MMVSFRQRKQSTDMLLVNIKLFLIVQKIKPFSGRLLTNEIQFHSSEFQFHTNEIQFHANKIQFHTNKFQFRQKENSISPFM